MKFQTEKIDFQKISIRLLDALTTIKINARLLHNKLIRIKYYENYWENQVRILLANEFLYNINQLHNLGNLNKNIITPEQDLDFHIISLFWYAFRDTTLQEFHLPNPDLVENFNNKWTKDIEPFFKKNFLDTLYSHSDHKDLLLAFSGYRDNLLEEGARAPFSNEFEYSWGSHKGIIFELLPNYSPIEQQNKNIIRENDFYEFFINTLTYPDVFEESNSSSDGGEFIEEWQTEIDSESFNEIDEGDETYYTVTYLILERLLAESRFGTQIFGLEIEMESIIESAMEGDELEEDFLANTREERFEARSYDYN